LKICGKRLTNNIAKRYKSIEPKLNLATFQEPRKRGFRVLLKGVIRNSLLVLNEEKKGLKNMATESFNDIFTRDVLNKLFPAERADSFFDALYGDAGEGAYDISLNFKTHQENRLEFELHLTQRPGKCITCSLTYGLPEVFKRHPIISVCPKNTQLESFMGRKI